MKIFYLIIYFVMTVPVLFGQKDSLYKVKVGPFKCSPDFRLQSPTSLSWANSGTITYTYYDEKKKTYLEKEETPELQDKFLIHSGPINPISFYYPPRTDSILTIRLVSDSTGNTGEFVRHEKRTSNTYEFMNL